MKSMTTAWIYSEVCCLFYWSTTPWKHSNKQTNGTITKV